MSGTWTNASTDMVRKASAEELVGHRDRALERIEAGFEAIIEGMKAYKTAAGTGHGLSSLTSSTGAMWSVVYSGITKRAMDDVRKEIDRDVWTYMAESLGLYTVMDATAKAKFQDDIEKDPPEVTVENLRATFGALRADADVIFRRGLVETFRRLDRRYRSHDAFKIDDRIVLGHALNEFGSWTRYGRDDDRIADLDRVMHVLDGKPVPDRCAALPSQILDAVRAGKRCGERIERGEIIDRDSYFRVKWFKNGNVHLWMLRPDLVEKANKLIAEECGATLGDAR
ncbi:DUF4942 domain-containing protein [Roseospira marina]|uniref:DUF4942 domain-containing protein n=1 Tax=Roseospira marina TaxID=140057 RepID=A0A5M6I8W5_9PROT|nr:DUF4942 domain-containing protein [Roseospira marina]KAA5604377.1 DUF4942 domain-containing protein [Roseospira marina]MBB4315435.1 hypothetical protein [Roseospira marina]MBB5088419.1 hypothetical protein [Roseospira marina]